MNFLELEFCNMTNFKLIISASELHEHVSKMLRDKEAKTFKLKVFFDQTRPDLSRFSVNILGFGSG
jgi:hypothetical protein